MSKSATPWAAAHQSPLSVGFSRQEYWSVLSFPSPGDPPIPGTEPESPSLAGWFSGVPWHRGHMRVGCSKVCGESPGNERSGTDGAPSCNIVCITTWVTPAWLTVLSLKHEDTHCFPNKETDFTRFKGKKQKHIVFWNGKGQFSFPFQRKAMPKNAQTTA